jgi:N-acetylmuramoyl-L-alanine amidase
MRRDAALFAGCLLLLAVVGLCADRVVPAAALNSSATSSRKTLILDAGHGGEDGGAVTAAGDCESQINLDIVRKTEQLLAFLGVDTKLTRQDEASLSTSGSTVRERKMSDLKNRADLINETSNAMLISVHQNYFTDPRYSGAQVFYAQNDLCCQWGEYTQEMLRQVLNADNRRAAKPISSDLYLFKQVSCPTLLVECGFLREPFGRKLDDGKGKDPVLLHGMWK